MSVRHAQLVTILLVVLIRRGNASRVRRGHTFLPLPLAVRFALLVVTVLVLWLSHLMTVQTAPRENTALVQERLLVAIVLLVSTLRPGAPHALPATPVNTASVPT